MLYFAISRFFISSRRASFLCASVATGTAIVLITEFLSLLKSLDFAGVSICWGAQCALLAGLAVYLSRKRKVRRAPYRRSLEKSLKLLLLGVGLILLVTFVIAVVSPPNNWDSMTYHMGRVAHWVQNGSVGVYPTHIVRQAYSNPWAEFAITQLRVLGRTDRFANLVQWFSFLGCVIGCSLIAESLGAGRRGQVYSAVVAATIPMAILQATSTQNDLTVSFWIVCFAYFGLRLARPGPAGSRAACILNPAVVGACIGLAVLAKGTAYVFVFPLLACLLIYVAVARRLGSIAVRAAMIILILLIALSLNAGHFARNGEFGSPVTGASDMPDVMNDAFTPQVLLSNLMRNATIHIYGKPRSLRDAMGRAVRFIHSALGIDVNDPRTTWPGTQYAAGDPVIYQEDLAGNTVHLALALLAFLYILLSAGLRRNRTALLYMSMLVVSALLFCLLFKWQPWHSRLHLPLFVLFSPLVGLALGAVDTAAIARFARKWRYLLAVPVLGGIAATAFLLTRWAGMRTSYRVALAAFLITLVIVLIPLLARRKPTNWVTVLCLALLVLASPYVLANMSRPLLGKGSVLTTPREELYFAARPGLTDSYTKCAESIRESGARDIGLIIGEDSYEYPLWALLGNATGGRYRIEHVDVTNSTTAAEAPPGFKPELIVLTGVSRPDEFTDEYGTYVLTRTFGAGVSEVDLYRLQVGD